MTGDLTSNLPIPLAAQLLTLVFKKLRRLAAAKIAREAREPNIPATIAAPAVLAMEGAGTQTNPGGG